MAREIDLLFPAPLDNTCHADFIAGAVMTGTRFGQMPVTVLKTRTLNKSPFAGLGLGSDAPWQSMTQRF